MIYTLMNKHIPLADINFSSLGHIDEICKVYTPEAFPVGIITKDNSPTSKITRDYLYNWWKNRIIPASRDGLNTLLHIYRIENTSSLAIKSLGLSLSDQYWIKPKGSDDRHYGNFGFIRNINTLKFISPAPIFDNGTSLWNNCLDSEIGEWQSCMPFKKNHREQIKLVTSFNISEQSLKKCERIIKNELSKSPLLSPHRIDKISKYVGNRARLLENIISKVNTLSR